MKTNLLGSIAFALLVILSSCKTSSSNSSSPDISGQWDLISCEGENLDLTIYGTDLPFIKVNAGNTEINGHNGCNSFFGSIESLTEKTIKFSPFGATRKACAREFKEHKIMKAFSNAVSYKASSKKLIFFDQNNTELLLFTKK